MNTSGKILSIALAIFVIGVVMFFAYKYMQVHPKLTTAPTPITPVQPVFDIAKDPYPGFIYSLVPAHAATSQYWQNAEKTGGLFVLNKPISAEASEYRIQLTKAGWAVLNVSSTTEQVSFALTNPKTFKAANIVINNLQSGAGVSIAVQIQK